MTKLKREYLDDGSFIDTAMEEIEPDRWRPHGIRYRLAWVQEGKCRVLFDNHHGKQDHVHLDDAEGPYRFISVERLFLDFRAEVRKRGGKL